MMPRTRVHAFTLIELLVAVSLLAIIIVVVGAVFRTTGRAIRTSNATIETDAAVRATMRQMAADLSRCDRNGFLSIRNNWGTSPVRASLTFIAHGGFANRTGPVDPQSNAVAAELNAHAAIVWYGFALTPQDTRAQSGNNYSENHPTTGDQDNNVQVSDISTAGTDSNNWANSALLARHTLLMVPANVPGDATRIAVSGAAIPAHPDPRRTGQAITVSATELPAAPSSGRTSVTSLSPGQLMARVRYEKYQPIAIEPYYCWNDGNLPHVTGATREGGFTPPFPWPMVGSVKKFIMPYNGADYWYESRHFNYPRKTLRNALQGRDSTGTRDVVNGTMRISPILLSYVDQFVVDWTDGSTDSSGNLQWFGNITRTNANNNPTVQCVDWVRDRANLPMQWPPADYYSRGYFAEGGYNTGGYEDSLMPALTSYRQTRDYTTSVTTGNPPVANPMYFYNGRNTAIVRDIYTANFGPGTIWPKAIRIMIRIDMAQTEITNFATQTSKPRRSYSQIVWLPS